MDVAAIGTWQIEQMHLSAMLEATGSYGLPRALVEELLLGDVQQIGTIRALRGDCVYSTVEWALAELGSDRFLANAARTRSENDQSALGLALRASETLGEALTRTCQYEAFWTTTVDLVLEQEGGHLMIVCRPQGSRRPGRGAMLAYLLASVWLNVGLITGMQLADARIELAWNPEDSVLGELLQIPVEFGAATTRLVLPRRYAELALPHGYSAFAEYFERDVGRQLEEIKTATRIEQRVAAYILRCVNTGHPAQLNGAAQELGLSKRSLQRRLADEGATFADISRRTREQASVHLLQMGELNVSQVGYLMGFADPASFVRAFRAWTGVTPGTLRAAATKSRGLDRTPNGTPRSKS